MGMKDEDSSGGTVAFGLVMFNSPGLEGEYVSTQSGWTRDIDIFLHRLSSIQLSRDYSYEAAIADGLSDALMMYPAHHDGVEIERHCVLVSASNPFHLSSPVSIPNAQKFKGKGELLWQTKCCIANAETVAAVFHQCAVSLSVISPAKLPKLQAIYDAGNANFGTPETFISNVDFPEHLILVSNKFLEARIVIRSPQVAEKLMEIAKEMLHVPVGLSDPSELSIASALIYETLVDALLEVPTSSRTMTSEDNDRYVSTHQTSLASKTPEEYEVREVDKTQIDP